MRAHARATATVVAPARHVPIHYKPGVLAFSNRRMGHLRKETMTIGGAGYVLISWRGRQWEVYRVDTSGLEIFVGYAPDCLASLVR